MQQHPLVARRQLERGRDLLRLPALDVAQDDDLLLARRKPGDRGAHLLQRLRRQQALLRQPRPTPRWDRPAAGIQRMVDTEEAIGVDRRTVLVELVAERGERDTA